MSELSQLSTALYQILVIGIGATLVMDVWAIVLKRLFNIPSLDYALVGRWLGHMPKGTFAHQSIFNAAPARFEKAIGWFSHYLIGVLFAGGLVAVVGSEWLTAPTLFPALLFGVATVIFPFFLMQPCLGLGIAASRTPKPMNARSKSLLTHAVFGLGMYLTAVIIL
ncbi:DUF2938 domain-containing protein [Litoribrevibacter euphylliae]|uniref:DUF2938 domain-containing protein n=1 Tax=Litoribrevibacter euphylliae TaxID=1834034 RepID=A0ABV7HDS5_9GAMM